VLVLQHPLRHRTDHCKLQDLADHAHRLPATTRYVHYNDRSRRRSAFLSRRVNSPPGIRPVIHDPTLEEWSYPVPVSCRLSPAGIRFLDILFPPEISALLTVGLPDRRPDGPDSVGVSVFRTHETRPGWVPSLPRGGGVLPISAASLIGACRFTTASPLPRCNLPPAELLITEHTKIHFRSPVRPFPRPSIPGGTGTLRLFPGLRTPRSPTTHARAGTVHRTLDRITSSSTDLQPA
jgi:hypothetical protein